MYGAFKEACEKCVQLCGDLAVDEQQFHCDMVGRLQGQFFGKAEYLSKLTLLESNGNHCLGLIRDYGRHLQEIIPHLFEGMFFFFCFWH